MIKKFPIYKFEDWTTLILWSSPEEMLEKYSQESVNDEVFWIVSVSLENFFDEKPNIHLSPFEKELFSNFFDLLIFHMETPISNEDISKIIENTFWDRKFVFSDDLSYELDLLKDFILSKSFLKKNDKIISLNIANIKVALSKFCWNFKYWLNIPHKYS